MPNENQNHSLLDQKNKEMAKSDDKRLKTKQEGDPDQNSEPGAVGGFSTGGSSDGTGSA